MKAHEALEALTRLVSAFPDADLVIDYANDPTETLRVTRLYALTGIETDIVVEAE